MQKEKIIWNKVSPAELSSVCCPDFFAFTRQKKLVLLNSVQNECLFTSVILASTSYSHSIYNLEIWIGYLDEEDTTVVSMSNRDELIGGLFEVAELEGMSASSNFLENISGLTA